jgi:hypothetical protein
MRYQTSEQAKHSRIKRHGLRKESEGEGQKMGKEEQDKEERVGQDRAA